MKPKRFYPSLIAIGITIALGISTRSMAATSGEAVTPVTITNKAFANYNIGGTAQPRVDSNPVIVNVSERLAFSLTADNIDNDNNPDRNSSIEVAPNGFAVFNHTLRNEGNLDDTYRVRIENVAGDNADYDIATSIASYRVFNANEDPNTATPSLSGQINLNDANGQLVPLKAGQFVKFTINAKTIGNKGGNTQDLRITATSTALTNSSPSGVASSLTNIDNSVTRLPTFSIIKTVTDGLNLNVSNDTASYRIVIRNPTTAYAAGATNIIVTDTLPAGLIMATPLVANDISVAGGATKGSIASNNDNKGFNITGADIPVGGSITITFSVKKEPNVALARGALNHVSVTDDLDNNPDTNNTLIDSTDSSAENVGDFYVTNDTDFTDGTIASGNDGNDSTQPLLTIRRELALTNPTIKEIAPTGEVTHQTLITNNGQDIEGDTRGELTFTIKDNDGSTPDAINIVPGSVTLTYDPDGPGSAAAVPAVPIAPNSSGVYDINTALPNGIAPGGTVNINYRVASTSAPLFTPADSTTPTTENTVVTLIPVGTGAPAQRIVTDTTTVRGLTLVKSQALDAACDGTADTDFSSNPTQPLTATPGQCVIYQIEGRNTSSAQPLGFIINDLAISDLLSNFTTTADYVPNSATAIVPNGTTVTSAATNNGSAITTTVSPLPPQAAASMRFGVRIKSDRAN